MQDMSIQNKTKWNKGLYMAKGSLYSRELSQKLGMSKDYLCVYRTYNRHLKSYNEAYDEVLKRRQEDFKMIERVQALYYELLETKNINAFGRHLVSIGMYTNSRSLHRTFEQAFCVRVKLIERSYFKVYEKILQEYEGYKKWL